MNDNDIIEAFDICSIYHWKCDESCPFSGNCWSNATEYAIDLINRQKAEIEELQRKVLMLYPKGSSCSMQVEVSDRIEREIKSEAIKEFAERLIDKIFTYTKYVDVDGVVILNRICRMMEDIEKEMTEEEK